jgi:hypothetical protein
LLLLAEGYHLPVSLPECSNAVKNRKFLSSEAPSNLDQKKRYSMDIHTQQTKSIPSLQANRRRSCELPRYPVRANNQFSQMKQIVRLHAHAVRSMQEEEQQQLRCMQMHKQLEPPDGGSRRSSSSSMQNRSVMSSVLEIHDNFQGMIVDLKVNRNANEQSSSLEFH